MRVKQPTTPFSPHEIRKFILPLALASITLLACVIGNTINGSSKSDYSIILYSVFGIIYFLISNILVVRFVVLHKNYGIINAILSGIGLGALSLVLPEHLSEVRHILIIFSSLAIATISDRRYVYLSLAGVLAISLPDQYSSLVDIETVLQFFMPIFVSIVVMEVIIRIKNTTQQHIHRLETINKVSRKIMQSLDAKQILSMLNDTIQDTLVADSYFIGFQDGNNIRLDLFYDDGEYFNGTTAPINGTLSGWVINNQKEVFLPDLRENTGIDGIDIFIAGKEKTSLSWIGVPLKAENVTGILALASYTPNAFDRADLELLISLGQHVTLALDNAISHEQVERLARLDSLTGVYNHGYFLKTLTKQAEESSKSNMPLSLIMMDIDYFKQYNDTYGHLVGDRILEALCNAIKQHIKQKDAVGRWGGEEFIISLPHATGKQAAQIAKRISETMRTLQVRDRDQNPVPIPTVSQGIGVYPYEADEIYQLIDIADKRLYVAKKRGRNQIEPVDDFWQE